MTRPLSLRLTRLAAFGLAAALLVLPRIAAADAWSALKGRIFISDTEFGSGFASDAEMVSAIKKQSKTSIKGDGSWTLHMTVFLKEPAGADKINIVYYDVEEARAGELQRGRRQARPEDGPAQRHLDLARPGLRQGAQVRRARDAPHRRQGKGLRQDAADAEVTVGWAAAGVAAALALAAC